MIPRLIPTAKTDPELAPFRSGLVFGFFNALSWQIGIGTPMVLFAEQLGASPFQVGLAYSFVFILTPIQIVSTALLPRHGYKKVMLGGWGMRSLFLAVPVVLAVLAPRIGSQPWMVDALVGSVFLFCFFRSIGAAAIIPWLYTILPIGVRGRYFASDQFISGVGGVGTLITSATLFALLPVYLALLIQYLIALTGSTLSFFALRKLPDAPNPTAISLGTVLRDTPRHMFARTPFRRFLWLSVWAAVVTTSIPPFTAYYLKVGPALATWQIMLFEVFRYTGVIMAAWVIGRRIDATGARGFLLLAVGLYAVVAVFWGFYLQTGAGGLGAIAGVYFVLGAAVACWNVAYLNYLPKVVPAEERTLMVAIYGAVTACLGGCSPILWGIFLKDSSGPGPAIDVNVFMGFFVFALVSAMVISSRVARLPEETRTSPEPLVIGNAILRPFRAATYLANLIDLQSIRPPASSKDNSPPRP